jgi:hypothetical protein
MRSQWITAALVLFKGFRLVCASGGGIAPRKNHTTPTWLVNYPQNFHPTDNVPLGTLLDFRGDAANMTKLVEFDDYHLARVDVYSDGELVDALEHFFWGMKYGLAIELGALDGSPGTRSQTYEYEKTLGWKRILIEGNPKYRTTLIKNSPLALSINAAICEKAGYVHYSTADYVGGIVEFMSPSFLRDFHNPIYKACMPPGNVSALNVTAVGHLLNEVTCLPLSTILHKARVKHVNYFILDVEVSYKFLLGFLHCSSMIRHDNYLDNINSTKSNHHSRPISYIIIFIPINSYCLLYTVFREVNMRFCEPSIGTM